MSSDSTDAPGKLGERWNWRSGAERRAFATNKLQFYTEQHLPLVKDKINSLIADSEARTQVAAFATRSNNLVKSVVDNVAVAYSRGVRRELVGVGEPAAKAFADIVEESGISGQGGAINAISWLCGPLLVGPSLVDGSLVLDVITPLSNEVRRAGPEVLTSVLYRVGEDWVEVDGESWRYYDSEGKRYHEEPHYVGACPLAVFRCSSYLGFGGDEGWWSASAHEGLLDASLLLAYKHAFGLWCTQHGSTFLTVVHTDLQNIAPGQSMGHPYLPMHISQASGGSPVSVFDRRVDPSRYLAEMAAITNGAVAPYGIPPSEVSFANDSNNWGILAINVRGEKLGLLRDKQVPWLLRGERRLWPIVADFVRGSSHRLARKLPPGDEVRDALRLTFPDLAAPDEIKKSIESLKMGLGLGITSVTEWLMQRRPELTQADALAILLENVDEYAEVIEAITSRNIPADDKGDGVRSIAQAQGRAGGVISGEVRRDGAAA